MPTLVLGFALGVAAEEPQTGGAGKKPEAQPSKAPKRVEFGVEIRLRGEFRDNNDFKPANDFDAFLGQRVRAHLRFRIHPDLSLYVQGQDVWLYGAESDKVIHSLGTNLYQIYLDWKPAGSEHW